MSKQFKDETLYQNPVKEREQYLIKEQIKKEIMDVNKMDARYIVHKVNQLFHLQETKNWEYQAMDIVSLSLELKFIEGSLSGLRSMQGEGCDDDKLSVRIDKLEQREFEVLSKIELL